MTAKQPERIEFTSFNGINNDDFHTRRKSHAIPDREVYYTYMMLHEESGYFYIGMSSCDGKPENHAYYGSGTLINECYRAQGYHLIDEAPTGWTKHIIEEFDSRTDAAKAEAKAIREARKSGSSLNRTHGKRSKEQERMDLVIKNMFKKYNPLGSIPTEVHVVTTVDAQFVTTIRLHDAKKFSFSKNSFTVDASELCAYHTFRFTKDPDHDYKITAIEKLSTNVV